MRAFNSKILVIDDDETIRDSFREILSPNKKADDSIVRLKEAESALFDDDPQGGPIHHKRSNATFDFIFYEAANGKKKALSTRHPKRNTTLSPKCFRNMVQKNRNSQNKRNTAALEKHCR